MKALAPALLIFSAGLLVIDGSLQKLLWTTLGLLFLLKLGALIRNHQQSVALPKGLGLFVFLFMWPGMRPEVFASRGGQGKSVGKEFVSGFLFFLSGLSLQMGLVIYWEHIHAGIRPYLGLASFLLLIHFGISSLLYSTYRMCGWPVEKLFREPFKSTSLKDFWGQRWNIPFVDLNKRLIFPLFPKKSPKILLVIGIFLTSGLLHEMAISYPAGAGWGTPMLYFALHGFLTSTEDYLPWKRLPTFAKRVWLWSVLLIPIPLLFHSPFLETFINPFFAFFQQVYDHLSLREWLHWGLIACGLGHLLVLVASSQVPKKLEWKEDFAHLTRLSIFGRNESQDARG